ncbi:MAG: hypothetical protein ACOCUD_03475 [Bacillota bacterium]
MKFIIFLDALDYNDLTPWFKDNLITQYNPGVPKVTPNVISQIMTGKRQEDLEFTRSTPFKKPRYTDIKDETICHYAAKERELKILQYGIPLCANIDLPEGSFSMYDHFIHGPQNIAPIFQFVRENVSFLDDHPELIFHSYVDQASILFSTIRALARNGNFDVIFLGYQPLDAYTHWYNRENRIRLLQYLEEEIKDLSRYGDILFFSDHGGQKQEKIFFVNKWLQEKGYLHYTIYEDLIEYHKELENKKEEKFPDMILPQDPFVKIDFEKTKFLCVDAFDCMIDATVNATEQDLENIKSELMNTGYFNSVNLKTEIFDKDGEHFEETPMIIADTALGVNASCNIHPNAEKGKNLENTRTGWHSHRGVVGSNDKELSTKISKPSDIYLLMKEFIDKQEPESKKRESDQKNLEDLLMEGQYI